MESTLAGMTTSTSTRESIVKTSLLDSSSSLSGLAAYSFHVHCKTWQSDCKLGYRVYWTLFIVMAPASPQTPHPPPILLPSLFPLVQSCCQLEVTPSHGHKIKFPFSLIQIVIVQYLFSIPLSRHSNSLGLVVVSDFLSRTYLHIIPRKYVRL